MDCSVPGLPVLRQLLELDQTQVHWVGDAIQPSHHLLPPSPPVFSLSQHQGLFQRVGSLHQMAKYWSFSFNISPSNEHSGLNSFRIDWLDLLAVQGTLKSLCQHHSSKTSIPYSIPITTIPPGLWCSPGWVRGNYHTQKSSFIWMPGRRSCCISKVIYEIDNMLVDC